MPTQDTGPVTPNILQRINRAVNTEIYPTFVGRGREGGGFRGAAGRFGRGVVNETIANTPREAIVGGPINIIRGIVAGLRSAWDGRTRGPEMRADPRNVNAGPPDPNATAVDPRNVNAGPRDPNATAVDPRNVHAGPPGGSSGGGGRDFMSGSMAPAGWGSGAMGNWSGPGGAGNLPWASHFRLQRG